MLAQLKRTPYQECLVGRASNLLCIGCIGLEDGHNWESRINELRGRHRISAG